RRRHTRFSRDWSSDVCSSDLLINLTAKLSLILFSMEIEFQKKWDDLKRRLDQRFEDDLDVQAILFLIGLQELGKKVEKLSKDQRSEERRVGKESSTQWRQEHW